MKVLRVVMIGFLLVFLSENAIADMLSWNNPLLRLNCAKLSGESANQCYKINEADFKQSMTAYCRSELSKFRLSNPNNVSWQEVESMKLSILKKCIEKRTEYFIQAQKNLIDFGGSNLDPFNVDEELLSVRNDCSGLSGTDLTICNIKLTMKIWLNMQIGSVKECNLRAKNFMLFLLC